MSTLYRVIVATHVPFCEPVEFAFGPAQPDKFTALLSLGAALDLHDSGSFTTSVRIECTEAPADGLTELDVPRGNSAVAVTPNGGF